MDKLGAGRRQARPSKHIWDLSYRNKSSKRKTSRSKLSRGPRGKQFIKIKIFHRSFLLKSFHAVNNLQLFSSWSGSFCLPNEKRAKAQECQKTLGRATYPPSGQQQAVKASPGLHPHRKGSTVARGTERDTL